MNISNFNINQFKFRTGEFIKPTERKNSQKLTPQTFTFEKQRLPEEDSTLPLGKITKMPSVYREVNDYFLFIEEIEELSDEEKESIFRAIESSLTKTTRASDEHDFAITLAQTKFELEFLADHIIPERFQAQMNKAVESFITYKVEIREKTTASAYEKLRELTEKYNFLTYSKEGITKELQNVKDGKHIFQTISPKYIALFEQLRVGDPKDFLQNYENILAIYAQDQKESRASFWNKEQAKGVEGMKESLREKWNHFLDQLSGFEQWRLPTQAKAFVDVKI